jgi:hypothetical protein
MQNQYGANTVYTCMWMEKWYLLKQYKEGAGEVIKEIGGEGEFIYTIYNIL